MAKDKIDRLLENLPNKTAEQIAKEHERMSPKERDEFYRRFKREMKKEFKEIDELLLKKG